MTPSQTIPTLDQLNALYMAANQADELFQLALIAQFGLKQAGDARYHSARHNDNVKACAKVYHHACDAWRAAYHLRQSIGNV